MLENFRAQKIIWDRANKKIFETIEANSGDSNGRKLVVQVINQETTENLSGTTLSLGWKSRKGAKGLDAFDVVDASKGIFEIYYTTEMLSNIGNIEASLILIDSNGRIESSTFTISVRPSTIDDESVESENSFTALTEALVKVNDFDAQLAETNKQKVDKGGNEQITMPMLAPDIKQAINDGVWDVNVNTSDIEDNAVNKFKADFYPQKDLILKNLYQYGNFTSTTGVYSGNSNFEVSNNEVTFTATAKNGYIQLLMSEPHNPAHKYYIRAAVKSESESDTTNVTLIGKSGRRHSGSGNYETISIVYDNLTSGSLRISDMRTSGFTPIKVKQVIGINLTESFGAGNEPMAEYMDTIMTQFENDWFGGEKKAKDNALDIGKVWANVDGKMKMAKVSEVNDDIIIGKNILANNDFTQGFSFWNPYNSNLSLESGVLRATGTGDNRVIGATQTLNVVSDGLYYLRARIRTLSDVADSLTMFDGSSTSAVVNNPQKNQWYEISGVQNLGLNRVYVAGFFPNATLANGAIIEIEKTMVINLTETFGAGNEPSSSEMDVILERVGWFGTEKELVTLKTLATGKADKEDVKPLHGKKIVFAGDSVTEFGNYPEVAGEKTGAEVINIGIGGSCMVRHSAPNYDVFSMTNLADAIATGDWSSQIANKITAPDDNNTSVVDRMIAIDWNTVDILCIAHGTNDYRGGASYNFGDEGDVGKTSFIGGLAYIVETILTAHPHISIVFITPTWRKLDGVDADTVAVSNGKYLVDYIDAIIKNAEKYKTPVKDMYRTSGFNKFTADLYLDGGGDVHPNPTGYKHFGNKVGAFLISQF